MLVGEEAYELVREAPGWRVFLNWAGGVRVRFSAAMGEGIPLQVSISPAETLLAPGEGVRVTVRAENLSPRDIMVRVGHRTEPKAQADSLALLQCPLFIPVTLEAGQPEEFVSEYLLLKDVPKGATEPLSASSLSRGLVRQGAHGAVSVPRHIAWLLARSEDALAAIRRLPHSLSLVPVIGWALLLPILFYLNQARHHAFERDEVLIDLLGAAIVVAGWGLRAWAKNHSRQGSAGLDLTGAGTLVILLGFGVVLESWWAFVLLCAAAAFVQASRARPGRPGRESGSQEPAPLAFFWKEAELLGLCVLAIGAIEVSEYLYRLHLLR